MLESPKIGLSFVLVLAPQSSVLVFDTTYAKRKKKKNESKTKVYVFDTQSAGVLKRINIQFTARYRARYNWVFVYWIEYVNDVLAQKFTVVGLAYANGKTHFICAVYSVLTLITRSRLCFSISCLCSFFFLFSFQTINSILLVKACGAAGKQVKKDWRRNNSKWKACLSCTLYKLALTVVGRRSGMKTKAHASSHTLTQINFGIQLQP